jgi:hypothetical protein
MIFQYLVGTYYVLGSVVISGNKAMIITVLGEPIWEKCSSGDNKHVEAHVWKDPVLCELLTVTSPREGLGNAPIKMEVFACVFETGSCYVAQHDLEPMLSHPPLSFSCSTGVWTQELTIARQVFYHLSHSTTPTSFSWAARIIGVYCHIPFKWSF